MFIMVVIFNTLRERSVEIFITVVTILAIVFRLTTILPAFVIFLAALFVFGLVYLLATVVLNAFVVFFDL
jgi:hypothetical protein